MHVSVSTLVPEVIASMDNHSKVQSRLLLYSSDITRGLPPLDILQNLLTYMVNCPHMQNEREKGNATAEIDITIHVV